MDNVESANKFEFNAPQYKQNLESLAMEDPDEADTYFDVLETPTAPKGTNIPRTPVNIDRLTFDKFMTPCANKEDNTLHNMTNSPPLHHIEEDVIPKNDSNKMILKAGRKTIAIAGGEKRTILKARRRWSASMKTEKGLEKINDVINGLTEGVISKLKVFEGIELISPHPSSAKKHTMRTRQDLTISKETINLRGRSIIKKREASPIGPLPPKKYLTLAESIYHFHKDTPPRFHSNRRNSPPKFNIEKPKLTVPNTPKLKTKIRARYTNILPHEEQELKVIEQFRKEHQIARPVPETQIHRKEVKVEEPKPSFVFKAQAIPKSVLNPTSVNIRRIRIPITKVINQVGEVKEELNSQVGDGLRLTTKLNSSIRVTELTSYERGMHMIKKKEEKIKKIWEEEKKKREFHAQPLPSFLTSKRYQRK